jgi:hypothetical protein
MRRGGKYSRKAAIPARISSSSDWHGIEAVEQHRDSVAGLDLAVGLEHHGDRAVVGPACLAAGVDHREQHLLEAALPYQRRRSTMWSMYSGNI